MFSVGFAPRSYARSDERCLTDHQGAHLVVILNEWNEFRALARTKMAKKMEIARMADLRNVYSEEEAKEGGFEVYVGIGR